MRKLFLALLAMSIIMAVAAPAAAQEVTPEPTAQADTDTWRVRRVSDGSYGPELGLSRPGVGTSVNEVATIVGFTLTFKTAQGEVVLDGGCQQAVLLPEVYARNSGGEDWGFTVWEINPAVTNAMNEIAVLSFELAKQQVTMEDCEDLPDTDVLSHVWVVTQDENNPRLVVLTPWREFRRATGEDAVLMVAPGDSFFGWHVGIGDSQDNLCDGGNCYLQSSPTWGWGGGGVINSTWEGEIPENATPITATKIRRVLATIANDN